ncbi:MAG TPA: 30S ribosomal protein S17 [Chloroflexota bacterium]|nr:30S ribosomal protein S17 [Chloroflexota bacterium]
MTEKEITVGNASRRKSREGTVVSDKMEKTVVVSVESMKRHPLYGKTMRRSTKFKVHDEENRCKVGDVVRIRESRPFSKDKHWVVEEILRHEERAI